MTFNEFLDANNLPHIGETVITPAGTKAEVKRYVFDDYCNYVEVYIETINFCVIEWTLDQIKVCKRKEN